MLAALEAGTPGTPDWIKVFGLESFDFALRESSVIRLKFGGFTFQLDDAGRQEVGEGAFSIVLGRALLA